MLSSLRIINFGLIEKLEIEFDPGLNVLTGSTGAGKSIIIDGLRLTLGERLRSAQIREKTSPCRLQAVFEIRDPVLRQHPLVIDLLDTDHVLIIDREIFAENRSKVKVNGNPVSIGQLKDIGNLLIDFHGPHDHQRLLNQDSHIEILDHLTDFKGQKSVYQTAYQDLVKSRAELAGLRELSHSRERDLDLLGHQVQELSQVALTDAAYEELCVEQVQLQNSERLFEHTSGLIELFEQEEIGVSERIRQGFGAMKSLQNIDTQGGQFLDSLSLIQEQSDQLLNELKAYRDNICFEPQEAVEISRKYDIYEDIKRKYGPTMSDARIFFDKAAQKLELLKNLEHNDTELQEKIDQQTQGLRKLAAGLTKARYASAQTLCTTIKKELQDLGIRQVDFEVRISQADFHALGQDAVAFYISPNAGEDLKPLSQIVSSGEAARVMLALKKALTHVDPVPVLIFDEIDAQIGGRLGAVTGRKLKELSQARQVLLITHLPQIASFGDEHFKVEKAVEKGRTVTRVRQLGQQERIAELAQMMSGEQQTEVSIDHAENMLAQARR